MNDVVETGNVYVPVGQTDFNRWHFRFSLLTTHVFVAHLKIFVRM